jgi:D-alanyl-D-alanine carboxypeptidase/D-alanyl-D-alanine-endopeptidase (penicillin-binding protein 4)
MKCLSDGSAHRREVPDMKKFLFHIVLLATVSSCAAQRKNISDAPAQRFLRDTSLRHAHVGISIYDPSSKKFLYEYQPEKYFVPASCTKIVTAYASLKHLRHLLTGIRYYENDTAVYLVPTGDPTLLHRDFRSQPVIDFLKKQTKKIYIIDQNWKDQALGKGWSWDDFSDEYMTERNALPVYGNTLKWVQEKIQSNSTGPEQSMSVYSDPEVNWKVGFEPDPLEPKFEVKRARSENVFTITEGIEDRKELFVPFVTNGLQTSLELLVDTIHKRIEVNNHFLVSNPQKKDISSQPLDSVLRPMMYRSDNFFAEQLLLMVSEERFGVLDAGMIIDSLLATDLAFLPQKPVWVDGSGLSRYNLFSPRDFVLILDSMQQQFGMERMKAILPTGDSGTLKGYFNGASGRQVFAKTGSMSGVCALSGYLITEDRRVLIFSILINNFNGKVTPVRRAMERFLMEVR